MLTLVNPPSKLHYLRTMRSPAFLGCDNCKYGLRGHAALRGLGSLRAIGDATGAGVPAGTVLAYSASWPGSDIMRTVDSRPNSVQSAIQGILAGKWGIVIDNQQHTTSDILHIGGYSFVLQVHTTSDYGAPDDVRSIIDGEIYNYLRVMPQSTIRTVQSVSLGVPPSLTQQFPAQTQAALAAAQAGLQDALARGDQQSAQQFQNQINQITGQPASVTSWLSQNWGWLAAGAIALVGVRELL